MCLLEKSAISLNQQVLIQSAHCLLADLINFGCFWFYSKFAGTFTPTNITISTKFTHHITKPDDWKQRILIYASLEISLLFFAVACIWMVCVVLLTFIKVKLNKWHWRINGKGDYVPLHPFNVCNNGNTSILPSI